MTKTLATRATLAPAAQAPRTLSPQELLAVTGGATRSSGNTVSTNYYVRVSGKNARQGS